MFVIYGTLDLLETDSLTRKEEPLSKMLRSLCCRLCSDIPLQSPCCYYLYFLSSDHKVVELIIAKELVPTLIPRHRRFFILGVSKHLFMVV